MVKNGVDLVGRTGRSLEDIVAQDAEIDENVAAIVEAAREQATGLKEINTAVNSMDQATQQNAAMAEESTAASAELAAQAAELRLALARFDTGTGTPRADATVRRGQQRAA
jgi:methyl-accepting chemotaxis protein